MTILPPLYSIPQLHGSMHHEHQGWHVDERLPPQWIATTLMMMKFRHHPRTKATTDWRNSGVRPSSTRQMHHHPHPLCDNHHNITITTANTNTNTNITISKALSPTLPVLVSQHPTMTTWGSRRVFRHVSSARYVFFFYILLFWRLSTYSLCVRPLPPTTTATCVPHHPTKSETEGFFFFLY